MKTTTLSICLTLLFTAQAFGQTYSAAFAKFDHVWIGEDFTPAASTSVPDEVGANDGTLIGGDNTNTAGVAETGPTSWLPNALHFDGTSDYVQWGSGIDLTGEFTIAFWVYRDASGTAMPLIGDDETSNNYIRFRSVEYQIEYRIAGNANTTGNAGLADATWYHVAITRDSSNNIDVYRDGSLVLDNNSVAAGTFPLDTIAATNGGGGKLDGIMAQVGIADEALTATDIAQLYAGPPAGPSAPIIHHYRQRMSYLQWRDELNQDDRWSLALAP